MKINQNNLEMARKNNQQAFIDAGGLDEKNYTIGATK